MCVFFFSFQFCRPSDNTKCSQEKVTGYHVFCRQAIKKEVLTVFPKVTQPQLTQSLDAPTAIDLETKTLRMLVAIYLQFLAKKGS